MGCRYELRDYQVEVIDRLRSELRRCPRRRAVLQAATGAGKTVMAAYLIELCDRARNRCLFVARGRQLVGQTSEKLDGFGVEHGILMRGHRPEPQYRVQVASKDSFYSWFVRGGRTPPPAELVVTDECHESLSPTLRRVIELYPRAWHVGLTATPARSDGRGLGELWDALVCAVPTSQLVRQGHLAPFRCFAPDCPDLRGVPLGKDGDYQKKALARRMNTPRITGNAVEQWKRLAGGRRTLVACVNLEHAREVRDAYLAAGVPCEYMDGQMEGEERDAILARFGAGQTVVLTFVGVLAQGVDLPCAEVLQLLRPTRSLVLFLQLCGRVMRPHPGKAGCLLLDHAGACLVHGLPGEDVEWSLGEDSRPRPLGAGPDGQVPLVCCAGCGQLYRARPSCPNCGRRPERKGGPAGRPEHEDGMLVEVPREKPAESLEERKRYWTKCLFVMAAKDRAAGAAAHMYKARFGAWPRAEDGLPNVPEGADWRKKVAELYPWTRRVKRGA